MSNPCRRGMMPDCTPLEVARGLSSSGTRATKPTSRDASPLRYSSTCVRPIRSCVGLAFTILNHCVQFSRQDINMTDASRWKATVFVGGLSSMVTSSHVLDAFIPFGEIVEVQLPKSDAPKSSDPHRGFAYVEYEDVSDAKEAIDNMDQAEFFGRVIKVSQAKAPKSADEGLGSKTAIWQQASLTVCITTMSSDIIFRRAGLPRMPPTRRTGIRPWLWRLHRISCRDWKVWMSQALNRREESDSGSDLLHSDGVWMIRILRLFICMTYTWNSRTVNCSLDDPLFGPL